MVHIPAACEKVWKDRLAPMAPEFAEFLKRTPVSERHGRVFRPGNSSEGAIVSHPDFVCKIASRIGTKAGVVVNSGAKDGKGKFAILHDLRRAFGVRWANRLMPANLRELMRHESIETTMTFYAGQDAHRTASVLWAEVAKIDYRLV
jgi:integrase